MRFSTSSLYRSTFCLVLLLVAACAPIRIVTTMNVQPKNFFDVPEEGDFLSGGSDFAEPFFFPGPPSSDNMIVYGPGGSSPTGRFEPSIQVRLPGGSPAVRGEEEVLCFSASRSFEDVGTANYTVFRQGRTLEDRSRTTFLLNFAASEGLNAEIIFGRDANLGRNGFRQSRDDLAALQIVDGTLGAFQVGSVSSHRGIPVGRIRTNSLTRADMRVTTTLVVSFDEVGNTCKVTTTGGRSALPDGTLPTGYCNVGRTENASMAIRVWTAFPNRNPGRAPQLCISSGLATAVPPS